MRRLCVACLLALGPLGLAAAAAPAADYVIQISVDGLAPRFLEALLEEGAAPTFKRLQSEGAWTHNARTDFDYTITLPNHTCMITGRPVRDKTASPAAIAGHNWVINGDPGERTLHENRHAYVASAFDVAHDHGKRTSMFVSKDKFVVYDQSYDARSGAPDMTGDDNGRDKIDLYVETGIGPMTDRFVQEMKANPFHYSFLHYKDTDLSGHEKKWGGPEYMQALKDTDANLGKILALIDGDERLRGKTTLILSADHGGVDFNHFLMTNPLNYTIPFYVWGAGVTHADDLYQLNAASRVDPQGGRPDYTETGKQPIRNGDGGNLALKLLGLPAIPESFINAAQDLNVQ